MKTRLAVLLGISAMSMSSALAQTRNFQVSEGTNFSSALSPDSQSIAIDLQGEIRIMPAAGGDAKRLIDLPDEARFPSWSPDGSQLAFQHFAEGQWRIFVIGRDGRGLRQLTSGAADDREPVWMPDGKAILFSSDRAGNFDIWKVALAGGAPERITDAAAEEYFPTVSADGRIAFVSAEGRNRKLVVREPSGNRELVSGNNDLALPSWSPQGDRLAFVEYRRARIGNDAGISSVQIVAAAGGTATGVTGKDEDVFIGRPQWASATDLLYTADGKIKRASGKQVKTIAFTAGFTVMPAPDYPRKRQDFMSTAPQPVKGIVAPIVSPDGRKIAFTALGDLWLLTIGNPKPERLTDDAWMDLDPSWSPDGSKLAYSSDKRGTGTMEIYVRDMKSGQEELVGSATESLTAPVFSPDGRSIAVTMLDNGDWHANTPYLLDPKTKALRKVGDMMFKPSRATWSADGRTVAYVSLADASDRFRKGLNKLKLLSVDGAPARFVSPIAGASIGIRASSNLAISPDGRQAVFVEDGTLRTVAMLPDGSFTGTPRRMTNDLADHPSWAGDSGSVVFLSADRLKRVWLEDGRIEDIPLELNWARAIPKGRKVIRAGRLYDSRSAAYRNNVDILVEGNVIKEVVPRRDRWDGAEIIDASDKVVLPGLFENHVHNFNINGEITGRVALSYGVTSIREPGTDPIEGREFKESWASGRRMGPRLFTTGLIEGGRVFYPMSFPVRSPIALELELERAARMEVDFIKTYEQLDAPLLKRTIDWAHGYGIPVTSHDAYPAARFGVDAVEHIQTRDRLEVGDRLSVRGRLYQDMVQIYAQSGMAMVPTAYGYSMDSGGYFLGRDGRSLLDLPQVAMLPERFRSSDQIRRAAPGAGPGPSAALLKASGAPIKTLFDAGVPLPTGTDTSFFNVGFGVYGEMAYYVEAGLTPAQVLQQTTLVSARLNHVEDILGSIEPGKLADMVIVSGDPLARISDVLNVSTVIKDGAVYPLEVILAGPGGKDRK